MEWFVENWFLIIVSFAIGAVVSRFAFRFLEKPSAEQIKDIKQWLLWAVNVAEADLGEGTGKLKLRYVYDMFLGKFPYLAAIIPFDTFALWVDEALEEVEEWLKDEKIQNAVNELI